MNEPSFQEETHVGGSIGAHYGETSASLSILGCVTVVLEADSYWMRYALKCPSEWTLSLIWNTVPTDMTRDRMMGRDRTGMGGMGWGRERGGVER